MNAGQDGPDHDHGGHAGPEQGRRHGHGHHHHHLSEEMKGDRRVLWAVAVNLILTLAQIIGGLAAGSLALIADAIHNLSDAISLGIAFIARRIARRPSDATMTFGYVRAEIVAALINYTTLIVVGLYLLVEAVMRLFDPQPVAGWTVVIIAVIALVVDLVTVLLTIALACRSMNIRAAFLHNVADALGSVGVIIGGTVIILYDWHLIDPIITLAIAGYILWHALSEIGGAIRLLMLGTPPGHDIHDIMTAMEAIDGVEGVHHVHLWSIDERLTALEAHVVVGPETHFARAATIRGALKSMLRRDFAIAHATLEVEHPETACDGDAVRRVGH